MVNELLEIYYAFKKGTFWELQEPVGELLHLQDLLDSGLVHNIETFLETEVPIKIKYKVKTIKSYELFTHLQEVFNPDNLNKIESQNYTINILYKDKDSTALELKLSNPKKIYMVIKDNRGYHLTPIIDNCISHKNNKNTKRCKGLVNKIKHF